MRMIKFRCPHCDQKIGLAQQYAGKQVRCAKCKKALTVPQASTEAEQPDKAVIRFSCSNCPQKLKVSINHAGRKVRCPKCGAALVVPQAQEQEQLMAGASASGTTVADDLLESHAGMSEFLSKLEKPPQLIQHNSAIKFEQTVGIDNTMRCVSCGTLHSSNRSKCSLCGGQLTVDTGVNRSAANVKPADGEAEDIAPGIDNMVLGILSSIGFTVAGSIGWCVAAKFVGVGWVSFMAVVICCLAGAGFYLFTQNRSVAVGILAAMIGFMGILNGKTLIAKYVTMPKMKQFMSEGANQFGKMFENQPMGDAFYEDMVDNDDLMFAMTTLHLVEQGEIEEELADEMLDLKINGHEEVEKTDEIIKAEEKVRNTMEGWDKEKKKEVAKAQYGKLSAKYLSMFMETGAGKAASLVGAWIMSLSCQDIAWIPLGLFCAYKIARGEE
jgi:ribosomal protein S27E